MSAGSEDAKSLLCSAPVLDAPNVLLLFSSEVDGSTSGAGVAAGLVDSSSLPVTLYTHHTCSDVNHQQCFGLCWPRDATPRSTMKRSRRRGGRSTKWFHWRELWELY